MCYRSLLILFFMCLVNCNYLDDRLNFLYEERKLALGSNIGLSSNEEVVNNFIMKLKGEEIAQGFENPKNFPPSRHFFEEGKQLIEKSHIFDLIKKMPKGGALHIHDVSLLTADWLVKNVTYRSNLCMTTNPATKNLQMKFFEDLPEGWQYVKDVRANYSSSEEFDEKLRSLFTMQTDYPYKDINEVWIRFEQIYSLVTPIISYYPVFIDYLRSVMFHFRNDNVMYIELRASVPNVYYLNNTLLSIADTVNLMKRVSEDFVNEYPDFGGLKIIYTTDRNTEFLDPDIQLFRTLNRDNPDFVLGFDLVGQEDLGKPLIHYIDKLKDIPDVKVVYHAGETNWLGTSIDQNLLDALLLNATRIGHGYALNKHPLIIEEVKSKDIAVEICPLSNQILMLNQGDIRNHPASSLIAQGVQCVISSDGPAFWDALPLSHDFYLAFMGLASAQDDLRLLKTLAINSIKYSLLNETEKYYLIYNWQQNWDKFINDVIISYDL